MYFGCVFVSITTLWRKILCGIEWLWFVDLVGVPLEMGGSLAGTCERVVFPI